jgi:hypothetical protein
LRPSDLANWAGTSLEAASEIAGAAQTARALAPGGAIPPEAAAIMAAMVRMPPKPHEQMKVGEA